MVSNHESEDLEFESSSKAEEEFPPIQVEEL